MKKSYFALILLFVISLFTSCGNKKLSSEIKGKNDINNGTVYSAPLDSAKAPAEFQSITEVPIPESIVPELRAPAPQPVTPPPPRKPQPAKKQPSQPKKKPLGSYSTPLLNRNKERVLNIALAAKKINGYVLKPDEIFSFNGVVGERTIENGFKLAAIIVKGEYEKGVGGGVCQLSTTIFNAADRAGFEIIERHSHTKNVSYVPPKRDAAVSYPNLDFKFKNTKNYPVIIRANTSNGRVYVSIWKA